MITRDHVDAAARLARLKLSEAERERMIADLEKVVGYVDELFAADVSSLEGDDVEPMTHAPGVVPMSSPGLRRDLPIAVLGRQALAGNPGFDGAVVRVPRVVY
jgi:aspartyl/glutamyl-tRNA(Asn/Gln) amidotransferase C subunit